MKRFFSLVRGQGMSRGCARLRSVGPKSLELRHTAGFEGGTLEHLQAPQVDVLLDLVGKTKYYCLAH